MSFLAKDYDISNGDNSWEEQVSVTDGATSFQFVASWLNASDSEVKLQYSNDQVNFVDVPNLSATLSFGDSVVTFDINSITHRYYKAVFIANSSTSGILNIILP